MKKLLIVIFVSCFCLTGVACEKVIELEGAFITEITSAGSDNFGVKITYADDSRLGGKVVDTQVKFSKRGEILIWQEGGEKIHYTIEDYDEWYSMTVIFEKEEGKEKFERFDEVLSKSYFFSSEQSQDVTFRAVVGDIGINSAQTGEILVDSEPISKQFTLKISKN